MLVDRRRSRIKDRVSVIRLHENLRIVERLEGANRHFQLKAQSYIHKTYNKDR